MLLVLAPISPELALPPPDFCPRPSPSIVGVSAGSKTAGGRAGRFTFPNKTGDVVLTHSVRAYVLAPLGTRLYLGLTVSVAVLLVTVPKLLLTTTEYSALLSALLRAGVV